MSFRPGGARLANQRWLCGTVDRLRLASNIAGNPVPSKGRFFSQRRIISLLVATLPKPNPLGWSLLLPVRELWPKDAEQSDDASPWERLLRLWCLHRPQAFRLDHDNVVASVFLAMQQ